MKSRCSPKIFRNECESDPDESRLRTEIARDRTSAEVDPTSAAHDLLDSTLVEGRLGAYSGLRQLLAWTGCSSSRAGSNTRQRMGRLTDSKVRGFMVTETNSEACAQLKLVLHAASTARVTTLVLFSAPVGPILSIPIKLNAGGKPQICV